MKLANITTVASLVIFSVILFVLFFDVNASNISDTKNKVVDFVTGCHVPASPTFYDILAEKNERCQIRIVDARLNNAWESLKRTAEDGR